MSSYFTSPDRSNPGSEKAWRFLSDPTSCFKLGISVIVVSAAEEIIRRQFIWQSKNAYLSEDMSEVPLVIMSNMKRSPAAVSIDLLARALLHDNYADDDTRSLFVNSFLHLHSGLDRIHTDLGFKF